MATIDENVRLLKNFTVFENLTRKQLEEIAEKLIPRKYTAGETIFFEEEQGDKMFFLRQGRVKILRTSTQGKEQIIKFLGDAEVFGEVVLFGIDSYPVTAICQEDSEIEVLNRKDFRDFYLSHPEIGLGMLETMAQKLYYSQGMIKSLSLQDSRSKVIQALLQLTQEEGTVEIKELNQQELANFLSLTRETVSRNLNRLKKEGYLEISGREIIIPDRDKLKALLS